MPDREYLFRPMWRWLIPTSIGLILFTNHYTRDCVGALEKQLEFSTILPEQYALMNGFYFAPNIISPLLLGALSSLHGNNLGLYFLLAVTVSSVGHVLFAVGVDIANIPLLYIGRIISGSMYEIIDSLLPIVYLNQFFKPEWSTIIAILNVLLRSGSAVNFAVSPAMYRTFNLNAAVWTSAGVGVSAIAFMLIARYLELKWNAKVDEDDANTTSKRSKFSIESSEVEMTELSTHSQADESAINNNTRTAAATSLTFVSIISTLVPLHKFQSVFLYYLASGSFMYGAIVPFWFMGSKFFQDNFYLDVSTADGLMIIPEVKYNARFATFILKNYLCLKGNDHYIRFTARMCIRLL